MKATVCFSGVNDKICDIVRIHVNISVPVIGSTLSNILFFSD